MAGVARTLRGVLLVGLTAAVLLSCGYAAVTILIGTFFGGS